MDEQLSTKKVQEKIIGKVYLVCVDGNDYEFDHSPVTGREIMDAAGIPYSDGLLLILEDGTQRQVGLDEEIELKPGRSMIRKPNFKRGQPTPRMEEELKLVKHRYGELEVAPGGEWFIIDEWQLPPGWNKPAVSVLVLVPPGYSATPPDNFYTDNDLRLANGGVPGNASSNQVQAGRQWLQFSYHVDAATWRPHAQVLKGHNLLSYLDGVGVRLQEAS